MINAASPHLGLLLQPAANILCVLLQLLRHSLYTAAAACQLLRGLLAAAIQAALQRQGLLQAGSRVGLHSSSSRAAGTATVSIS
jgi:hypothetical protein